MNSEFIKMFNRVLGFVAMALKNSLKTSVAMILITATGLLWLEKIIPQQIYSFFAVPSAIVASFFAESPSFLEEGGKAIILFHNHLIRVTQDCSGYGFFCLLIAILISFGLRLAKRHKIFKFYIFAIPCAYGITICANGLRIISAFYAQKIAGAFLPPIFQASLHQGIGIVIFLSTLFTISFLLERKFNYE